MVLDDALARGWVTVTEVGEGGHVPELKVVNRGDVAVLLLDGEELVGAKQNRVLNLTILVPPSTRPPSRCRVSSRAGGDMSRTSSARPTARSLPRGERRRCTRSTISLEAHGTRRSDQQAVWSAIAEKSARLGAESDTAAMAAMFGSRSLARGFHRRVPAGRPSGWRGVPGERPSRRARAVRRGEHVAQALAEAGGGATRSMPSTGSRRGLPSRHTMEGPSIDAISASQSSVFSAVGEGEDVRLSGRDLIGAGLVARERAIHLSAFMTVSEA